MKTAAAPHRGVQRGELVVARRDHRAEVLLHDLRVVAQRAVHVGEQHAERREVVAVLVVHDFALILRGDAGEELALGFGDAELLVRVLHVLREHVPVGHLPFGGLDVVVDVVEVDVGHVLREPLEHRLALEPLQRVQPELRHPLRLALLMRDVADHGLVQALLGLVDVVLAVGPPELVLAEVNAADGHGASLSPESTCRGARQAGGERGPVGYLHYGDSNNSRPPPAMRSGTLR